MALARRTVNIPVVGSADERSDRKQVSAPKLLTLHNADLSERGAIKKRRGYTDLGSAEGLISGGLNGVYEPLQLHGGLVLGGGLGGGAANNLRSLCVTDRRRLRASTYEDRFNRSAAWSSVSGRLYVGWNQTNPAFGTVEWRVAAYDPDTWAQFNTDETPLSTPSDSPVHLFARDSSVVALYQDGTDIKVVESDDADISGWGSPQTLSVNTALLAGAKIAVTQKSGNVAYFCYTRNFGSTLATYQLDLTDFSVTLLDDWAVVGVRDIAYFSTEDEARIVAQDSSNGVRIRDPHAGSTTTVDGSATSGVTNVAIGYAPNSIGVDVGLVVYDWPDPGGTGDEKRWLYLQAFDPADISLGSSHELMGTFIDSKIHRGRFIVRHAPDPAETGTTETLGSRYLVEVGYNALLVETIAALSYGEAPRVEATTTGWLSPLVGFYTDKMWCPLGNYVDLKIFGGVGGGIGSESNNHQDLSMYEFDFTEHRAGFNISAHGMHVFAGGVPLFYDGGGIAALGLLQAPIISEISSAAGSGNVPSEATLSWVAVYEMTDNNGRRWLSPPSLPVEHTTGVGHDEATITVYVPPARLNVYGYMTRVALFRNTESDQANFRRTTPYDSTYAGDNVDWNEENDVLITYVDDNSDATINSNELLYTTGGVLEDSPPPPCTALAVHRRRLFLVHSETGDVWGSKLFVEGEGIRFSALLRIRNPFPDERPTAVVSTEGALLVFYRSRIAQIYGDGPNDLGQGEWSEMEFLPSHTAGAISQRCTEATPAGVFFVDERQGAMLLPYGGAPVPIGGDWPLGNYNDTGVRGVDWLEDRNEVRFTFTVGTYRAFHIDAQTWSTGDLGSSVSVTHTAMWDRLHVALTNLGVLAENTSYAYEEQVSGAPLLTLETAWIKLADLPGIQGRFRLWDVYLIGEYVDTHNLQVEIAYDYDDSDTYVARFSDAELAALDLYQLRVRPNRQQMQAIKLKVTEWVTGEGGPEAGATTEGFKLSQIRLDFGLHPGRRPWTKQSAQV